MKMPQDKGSWLDQAASLNEPTGETWKPDEGAAIAGKVITVSRGVGLNSASTHALLETEDGEQIGVWLSSVLSKQFAENKVSTGDVVGIRFLGWRENRRGDKYKTFATRVLVRSS